MDEGQEIVAKNYYRPTPEKMLRKHAPQYPKVKPFTINEITGDWAKPPRTHFADGGLFDLYTSPASSNPGRAIGLQPEPDCLRQL